MAWLFSQLSWFWETFAWAGVAAVALLTWFLIGLGLHFYRSAARQPSTSGSKKGELEIINGQDFSGKTVSIDGKHLINCTFHETRVTYSGGPYRLTHCHRKPGNIFFLTDSQSIIRATELMKFLGLVRTDITPPAA